MKNLNNKNIILCDYLWTGHHLMYIKTIAEELSRYGSKIYILNPKSEEIQEWIIENRLINIKSDFIEEQVHSKFFINKLNGLINRHKQWKHIESSIELLEKKYNFNTDLVFFPWIDNFIEPIPKLTLSFIKFKYKWAGLNFNIIKRDMSGKLNRSNLAMKPENFFHHKNCIGSFFLDENISVKLQDKFKDRNILDFPDFSISDKANKSIITEHILQKAKGRKIVSIMGSLSRRKGFYPLLKSSQKLKNKNFFFVFVGKFFDDFTQEEITEIVKIIASNPNNCYFYFDYLKSDAEFNNILSISNILFAAYLGFDFSSNFISKASIFKIPLIVTENTLMAQRVKKFNIGLTVKENNIVEIENAIIKLDKTKFSTENYDKALKEHSVEKISVQFNKLLKVDE